MRLFHRITIFGATSLLASISTLGGISNLPSDILKRSYDGDPDGLRVSPQKIMGPCGHPYPGYLRFYKPPLSLSEKKKTQFDRSHLIPLPVSTKASTPPDSLDSIVAPFPEAPSIVQTSSGFGDGGLFTTQSSDGTTWSVSSSPAEASSTPINISTPVAPVEETSTLTPIVESQEKPLKPVLDSRNSSQSLPSQLLYYFQQPLESARNKKDVIVPFDIPVQVQTTQTPPPSRSKATLIVE